MSVWAVDGAKVPASSARSVLFQATQGATGIVRPTDLEVKAAPAPDNTVRVQPGSGVMENRYLKDGGGQSYGASIQSEEALVIPDTSSGGGRTSYLIQKITDPEFEGQIPEDPLNHRYDSFELVSSVTSGSKYNKPYPYVVLAKIKQKANSTFITDDMITDMREVANPRQFTVRRPRQIVTGDAGMDLVTTKDDGEWFPNVGQQNIDIPEWATYMLISADWHNIRIAKGNNPYGQYWVEWGPYLRPSTRERATQHNFFNHFKLSGESYYQNWMLRSVVYIPYKYRGTNQLFVLKAKYSSSDKGLGIFATGGVNLDVHFQEIADKSTS